MAYTTIDDSGLFMNTVLYTGNGSTQAVTGVGFQPDLVWLKDRVRADNHALYDAVRGVTKAVYTDSTAIESTHATGLTAFDSDGWTMGSDSQINYNGDTYVGWNWKANGSGSANTDGSISSTVSANTTSGFSIVSYTGTGANATVGHGLGAAPNVVICKSLTAAQGWESYFSALGATETIRLDTTAAAQTASDRWNDTAPTSTVFSLGTEAAVNGSTETLLAYCFAEVAGYSKFGSYTGNADADGTFVYTGFRPAYVMCKITSGTDNWIIMDSKRLGYNEANYQLIANSILADQTPVRADLLSNGFKARSTNGEVNNGSYIYMAFAEAPFVNSSGVPCNAR